jgi:ABC-type nitrate/sulfonate/bicarbonate transport system substrate-binding protein
VLATARGQKPLIIATVQDRLTFELVVSKAIADATPPTASVEDRAKALKGKVIAVDAVGSIQQGYAKYIVAKGGLNPDADVTYTPISSPAMTASLAAGRVDAISAVPPWSTQAVSQGAGVMYVSSPLGDLPELTPFAVTGIATRAEYCQQNADTCKKFVKGLQTAVTFIHEHPDKALEIMKTKFADMDPAVLEAGFKYAADATPKTLQTTDAMLENAKMLAAQSGALKPDEKVPPVSQIYSNDYQP